MATFGENLRAARKRANLSQRELADAVGVKHNSVSNWENGQNSPSRETIEKLCRVLNIRPDTLFGEQAEDDFTYALYNEIRALSPENQQTLRDMAQFLRQQQERE